MILLIKYYYINLKFIFKVNNNKLKSLRYQFWYRNRNKFNNLFHKFSYMENIWKKYIKNVTYLFYNSHVLSEDY